MAFAWILRSMAGADGIATPLVGVDNRSLVARGALHRALEIAPAGRTMAVALDFGEKALFRAKLTFQNEADDFCRQCEITAPSLERFAGIACRIDGQ
jgi:hypothetical protein